MTTKRLLQTVLLQLVSTMMFGQVNFSQMTPNYSDSLQKNDIHFFLAGKGGKNKLWNFSQKLSSKLSNKVMFSKDSTNVISVVDNGQAYYYVFASDTLTQIGAESQKETKDFVIAKPIIRQSFVYGDSISRGFMCDGKYCGNHLFRQAGTTTSRVDAEGSIVMAEGDTIKNVKRIHTIDSYSVCMDLDYAALDSAKLTQVIDERYDWYLPESHYPIIGTVCSTTYLNMDAQHTTKYAFCSLDEVQTAKYVTMVEEYEDDDSESSFDNDTHLSDIIHYNVQVNGLKVDITYDLDIDATISTIIANHMGVTYRNNVWTQQAGAGQNVQIDCSGLSRGTYILYINVNGNVYSEKIIL